MVCRHKLVEHYRKRRALRAAFTVEIGHKKDDALALARTSSQLEFPKRSGTSLTHVALKR
jgi:hypothetical protein